MAKWRHGLVKSYKVWKHLEMIINIFTEVDDDAWFPDKIIGIVEN